MDKPTAPHTAEALEQLATSLMTALVQPIAAEVTRLRADVACQRMLLTMLLTQSPAHSHQAAQWIEEALHLAQAPTSMTGSRADQAQAQEQACAAIERMGRLIAQRITARHGSHVC